MILCYLILFMLLDVVYVIGLVVKLLCYIYVYVSFFCVGLWGGDECLDFDIR